MRIESFPRGAKVADALWLSINHLTKPCAAYFQGGDVWYVFTDGARVLIDNTTGILIDPKIPETDRDLLVEIARSSIDFVYFDPDGSFVDGWTIHEWEDNS